MLGDQFIKSTQKGVDLSLDVVGHLHVAQGFYIFQLVSLSHPDILAIFNQFKNIGPPEFLLLDCEVVLVQISLVQIECLQGHH